MEARHACRGPRGAAPTAGRRIRSPRAAACRSRPSRRAPEFDQHRSGALEQRRDRVPEPQRRERCNGRALKDAPASASGAGRSPLGSRPSTVPTRRDPNVHRTPVTRACSWSALAQPDDRPRCAGSRRPGGRARYRPDRPAGRAGRPAPRRATPRAAPPRTRPIGAVGRNRELRAHLRSAYAAPMT